MLAVLALIAAVTFLRLAAHCATQFRKRRRAQERPYYAMVCRCLK